ncbi:DUF4145 domain-containing protein [Pseudoalteromonas xiamenensis]|uniref:DUF4145 domain-containing protein n=1 Tax=Pseudoalteromonas xiamenensis TaxID=882626 RepID=A0A975HMJ1_9GAMM|nr:DUF4145 domain-containing protein [Pseudoalteromonas xiamenensis]QTH73181.1 DUF4145 domain-containing protein [Pseudoalteromonas xiamenensis]
MTILVSRCPRCNTNNITFNVLAAYEFARKPGNWQRNWEVFCLCRHCTQTTTFFVSQKNPSDDAFFRENKYLQATQSMNNYVYIKNYVSITGNQGVNPPEYLPQRIDDVFKEASQCLTHSCYNASASMYRLCLDLATKEILEKIDTDKQPASKIARSLGLRLQWLFDNNHLPLELKDLSHCIKEDGNDGAHEATLQKIDAEDIQDFTSLLLTKMYTDPKRLQIADERRKTRRQQILISK